MPRLPTAFALRSTASAKKDPSLLGSKIFTNVASFDHLVGEG
jgi:hypothetical protein